MSKLIIIDGYSLLNRAYFAMPELTDDSGRHTGAVFGFINILQRLMEDEAPDHIAVAMDEKAPTFRHRMFEAYKGTRKPMDEALRSQIDIFKELLQAMHIRTVSLAGYEADDIIGSLARSLCSQFSEVVIVSGDRDLLQLIRDNISMRLLRSTKGKSTAESFDADAVMNEFQVSPAGIIELKALMGDASDNIPGVRGIGEKTAVKLLKEYGSIDGIYDGIDEVKPDRIKRLLLEDKEMCMLSRDLATIKCDIELNIKPEELKCYDYYGDEAVYILFKQLNFKKHLDKFHIHPSGAAADALIKLDMSYELLKGRQPECLGDIIAIAPVEQGGILRGLIISDDRTSLLADIETCGITGLRELFFELIKSKNTAFFDIKQLIKLLHPDSAEDIKEHFDIYTASTVYDIGLMAYIIDSNKGSLIGSQSGMLSMILKEAVPDIKEAADIKNAKAAELPALIEYTAALSKLLPAAARAASDMLKDADLMSIYKEIELPLAVVLADMELTGIRADATVFQELSDEFSGKIKALEAEIYMQAGEIFNINSPKQLGEILFERLGIPSGKKTKSGYSTAIDVLDRLKDDYKIVQDVLQYRHYSKLKSTYADALPQYIAADGRIHTVFNQTVASTGRLSSIEPNLQNIPTREADGRRLRRGFVANEGCVLTDADYSQIELRVLAHMSGDSELISAYSRDKDIHRMTAAAVFKLPADEVTDRQRSNAKAVNFGIIYGISAFGLSNDIDISIKEAKSFIDSYFEIFPNIKAFLDSLVAFAREKGYAQTIFGRRRYIPELNSSNFMTRSFGERIAMNAPIQGTAADIIKLAMIRIYRRLHREKLQAKLILQVHDELMIEVPECEKDRVSEILGTEMAQAAKLAVPLTVDLSCGYSWYDAKA